MDKALTILVLLGGVGCGAILVVRWTIQRRAARGRRVFEVRFPRSLSVEDVEGFVRSMSGLLPPRWRRPFALPVVVWEIRADAEAISFHLRIEAGSTEFVVGQLRSALPAARIVEAEQPAPMRPTLAAELRLSSSARLLRVDQPASAVAALLGAMRPLRPGEELVMQWVLAPAVTPPPIEAPSQRRPAQTPRAFGSLFTFAGRSGSAVPKDKEAREKRRGPHFLATVRLGVCADTPQRSRQLLRRLIGPFHVFNASGVSFRRRLVPATLVAYRIVRAHAPLLKYACFLTSREVAVLLAIPLGEVVIPGLDLGQARQLPPATAIPSSGFVLARSNFPGAEQPLALAPLDALRHLHVIGPTGVGKSTVLVNFCVQVMRAGRGLIVIDPKADLVADVLARVPADRVEDVILFDAADDARPIGFNVFESAGGDAELMVEQIVGTLKNIFSSSWGPRTDDIMRAACLTLTQVAGSSLVEVPLLLTNPTARRRFTQTIDEPVGLGPFWGWFESLSDGERTQAIGPVLNKIRAFAMRRRIRNIIGQSHSTFDLADVLDGKKILLCSLPAGLLGPDVSALTGSLLVAALWRTVQQRAAIPASKRQPVFCVLDEFQNFVHLPTPIDAVLAEARGLGLGLVLAHQNLAQLPPATIRPGVLGNAKSRLVFQTAASDAAVLAKELSPHLTAEDLRGLREFEVALSISVGGHVAPPATGVTLPAPEPTGSGERARALSRERYGRDRTEVEAEIRRRHGERPGQGSVGARRRR